MWCILMIIIAVTFIIILVTLSIVACIGFYFKKTIIKCNSRNRVEGKTVIVTGGTSGMGLEIAKELAKRGAKVIIANHFEHECIAARNQIVAETGNGNVTYKVLNLASLKSVRSFAKDVIKTEENLDILINNGVLFPNVLTEDCLNSVMQVNYFGHFLLTLLLLPLLNKTGSSTEKAIVTNTSSMSHSIGAVTIGNMDKWSFKSYAISKLCVAVFTRELSKKLEGSQVVVNTVDPGVAMTNIANGTFLQGFKVLVKDVYPSPWEGAQTALHVALDDDARKANGEYIYKCKVSKPDNKAYDEEMSRMLWEESVRLVKLSESELKYAFN